MSPELEELVQTHPIAVWRMMYKAGMDCSGVEASFMKRGESQGFKPEDSLQLLNLIKETIYTK